MKHLKLFAVVIILILLFSSIAAISYIILNKQGKEVYELQKPFYVGVTYGGSSIQEAKELIDKVKNYTNLFILQSGELVMRNSAVVEEIGDYAIASNLNYAAFCGLSDRGIFVWLNEAKERWGEHFTGVYYNDEPGGKMLDSGVILESTITQENGGISITHEITKHAGGALDCAINDARITYQPDGEITSITSQSDHSENRIHTFSTIITYYPNGTITIRENESTLILDDDFKVVDSFTEEPIFYTSENITKYQSPIQSYEKILNQNPIQNYNDVAKAFVNVTNEVLSSRFLNKTLLEDSILVFTADYGLYWWDYQKGYDLVLAEMGWNHTITQDIGLIRGAANLQNKSWGTILTWKYDQPPYLTDGEEMFEQMKTSYQTGAEYILIFNYSEDPENPNTLQEEHFQALEHFWNDVVQNPKIKHGSIKAEAALVLPQNYGWGMRHPNDNIWGIWQADDTSQQIWNQVQNKIEAHGLKLDIVYEDPNYPVAGKYSNIYYWNQE